VWPNAQALSGKAVRALVLKFYSMKKSIRLRGLAPAFSVSMLSLACGAALGQTASEVNPVVVTATRFEEPLNQVPANVKVITKEEIQQSSAINIPEILQQIGGVFVNNQGQLGLGATVDLGGFGATSSSNTQVLVDGRKLNPVDSTAISWEMIPVSSIERIEILKGGASVQYGNGAVGGVINIITKGGLGDSASVTLGSYGTEVVDVIKNLNADDLNIRMASNVSHSTGWRQNSAANAYALNFDITKKINATDQVFLGVSASHSDAQQPGGVIGQVGQGDPASAKFNNIGSVASGDNLNLNLGTSLALNDAWRFEGEIFYRNRVSQYSYPYYDSADSLASEYSSPDMNKLTTRSIDFTPRLKANFDDYGQLIIGYDLNRSLTSAGDAYGMLAEQNILSYQVSVNPNGYYYNNLLSDSQGVALLNNSIYGIYNFPVSEKVESVFGFRRQVENVNSYDINISSPSLINSSQSYSANAADIALNYKYSRAQKFYAKFGQSFRFANSDEFWGFDPVTSARIFTGALKPQTSRFFEIGTDWRGQASRVSVSAFTSVTENEIRYDPTTGFNDNSKDPIARRGISVDASTQITSDLTVSAGGKVQHSFYSSGVYAGTGLGLVPDVVLNSRFVYKVNSNFSYGGAVNYVGSQSYDVDPTLIPSLSKMPSYKVIDVFANYSVSNWDFKVMFKNINNEKYAQYGTNGFISLPAGSYILNSYSYVPAEPRTLFVSAGYKF
jgi:iron complex outermembrane receptor protein